MSAEIIVMRPLRGRTASRGEHRAWLGMRHEVIESLSALLVILTTDRPAGGDTEDPELVRDVARLLGAFQRLEVEEGLTDDQLLKVRDRLIGLQGVLMDIAVRLRKIGMLSPTFVSWPNQSRADQGAHPVSRTDARLDQV